MRPLQRQQLSTNLPIIPLLYLYGSSLLIAKEGQFLNVTDITPLSQCSAVKLLHNWSVVLYVCLCVFLCCASVVIQYDFGDGGERGCVRERSACLNLLSLVASQCPLCKCAAQVFAYRRTVTNMISCFPL